MTKLRLGDAGADVKNLQRGLNKLGEMLLVDGQLGPITQEAIVAARSALALPGPPVADTPLNEALAHLPDPSPTCTVSGVTFIAREEVVSAANYRRHRQHPIWPQPGHGITIGIGYSLMCAATPEVFTGDWGG
jgi:peptidoglycan hydrolase-like protein with peptidoglycan-binding domain